MMRPVKYMFQGFQNKIRTFVPSKVNLANIEFADEVTPNTQKKQNNPN